MKRTRITGFTLVEILVVVAIVLILMGLLLPALVGAYDHASRVKCLGNLHQLGLAYMNRKVDEAAGQVQKLYGNTVRSGGAGQYVTYGAGTWPSHSTYFPGVQYQCKVYNCPSDKSQHMCGATAVVSVYDVNTYVYDLPIEDGPMTSIVSNTASYVKYGLEDVRWIPTTDNDRNDVFAEIWDQGNCKGQIKVWQGSGTWNYKLVESGSVLGSFGGGNATPLGPVDVTIINSSYGYNAELYKLTTGKTRILALDYTKAVANFSSTFGTYSSLAPDNWPTSVGKRHFKRCNVAFTDGHVENMYPDLIDPGISGIYSNYWTR